MTPEETRKPYSRWKKSTDLVYGKIRTLKCTKYGKIDDKRAYKDVKTGIDYLEGIIKEIEGD